MATTVLKVSGMTCSHCVRSVTEALEGVEGVTSAEVDLDAGRARVEYDDAQTNPRALATAVNDEGYSAEAT
jgi:copper ion binding protein